MGCDTDRLQVVLTVGAAVVGVIAVILAIVAITGQPPVTLTSATLGSASPNVSSPTPAQQTDISGKRIWTIAVGHDWGAYEYFDDKGYLTGFTGELLKMVCQAGGMDCRTVWMPYTKCYKASEGAHPQGGSALLDGWVDACTGWTQTLERMHIFDFSKPFLKQGTSHFYVKPGATFNGADLSGKKIGFLDGWSTSEQCLARQNNPPTRQNYILKHDQIVHAPTTDKLVDMIVKGQVDAAYASYDALDVYEQNNQIQRLTIWTFTCGLGGPSMMTRKGSDFLAAWNDAFNKLSSGGGFMQLCEQSQKKHAGKGKVECVD